MSEWVLQSLWWCSWWSQKTIQQIVFVTNSQATKHYNCNSNSNGNSSNNKKKNSFWFDFQFIPWKHIFSFSTKKKFTCQGKIIAAALHLFAETKSSLKLLLLFGDSRRQTVHIVWQIYSFFSLSFQFRETIWLNFL